MIYTKLMFSLLTLIGLMSCSSKEEPNTSDNDISAIPENLRNTTGIEEFLTQVDYNNPNNWLSVPTSITKDVDVVYFYPTAYLRTDPENQNEVCGIDNEIMRKSAQGLLTSQASVFAESCNIFAPYYRQFDVSALAAFSDEIFNEHLKFSAAHDPSDALDYYFEHFNNGRPFILAGHSQGSNISLYLLKDYFHAHPDYAKRMIAAYPIGFGFTQKDIDEIGFLKFAEGEEDIKVLVSWNTESPVNKNQNNVVVKEGEININPLNWKRTDEYAPIEMNKGSLSPDGSIVKGVADAQLDLDRGVVVVSSPEAQPYIMANPGMLPYFGPGSFHGNDYQLFYVNFQENVAKRIAKYFEDN